MILLIILIALFELAILLLFRKVIKLEQFARHLMILNIDLNYSPDQEKHYGSKHYGDKPEKLLCFGCCVSGTLCDECLDKDACIDDMMND